MKHATSIAIGAALFSLAACTTDNDTGPLGNVDSILILQRPARNDDGNVFAYTSYIPGAHILKLSPPTANGKVTPICCDQQPELAGMDIQSYDLSFDATKIVFSGHSAADSNYGLYLLDIDSGVVTQLATDPGRDYVYPTFVPGDKILFETNNAVSNPTTDVNPPQHQDEYERATTAQVGTINIDGTGEVLGPRNLSHRVMPSLASDGRIIFTEWDHLGPTNQGDLMFMNPDMTNLREAFGKEGDSLQNSTLKAREISPGRFIAIGTARDRTVQAGALMDIRLGIPYEENGVLKADQLMSEANATEVNLTPDVPLDMTPSTNSVGRYYDAWPLDGTAHPQLLVSWADGPVETEELAAAGLNANFGIYEYDSSTSERHPIFDDPTMWDILARPLAPHAAPPTLPSAINTSQGYQATIGAMNVYTSTLHTFTPGSVYGVRAMEGFSSEEGFPMMFGTTEFEGQADLGVAPVQADGSWLATVPANVPTHLQAVDQFGMSLFNEPVWFSSRPGESRVCGGCHENRATTTVIDPGQTDAGAIGPTDLMSSVTRANRMTQPADMVDPNAIASDGTGIAKIVGVSWGGADPTVADGTGGVQSVFDAKCISCHNGTSATDESLDNYTLSDGSGNVVLQWHFNLSSTPVAVNYGPLSDDNANNQSFTASYLTMAGPDMEAIEENGLIVTGTINIYMNPEDAAHSPLIEKLNPTKLFPQPDAGTRAFATTPHAQEEGFTDLTPAEFYKLILATDMGVNYYSRENNPHSAN